MYLELNEISQEIFKSQVKLWNFVLNWFVEEFCSYFLKQRTAEESSRFSVSQLAKAFLKTKEIVLWWSEIPVSYTSHFIQPCLLVKINLILGATGKSILERKTLLRRFLCGEREVACDILRFIVLHWFFHNKRKFFKKNKIHYK